jgi:hypothetical protein
MLIKMKQVGGRYQSPKNFPENLMVAVLGLQEEPASRFWLSMLGSPQKKKKDKILHVRSRTVNIL